MFPSVPPLKVVASFSLSMVHAGLILSQLSVNQAGNQKDKDDGANRAPPAAAETASDEKVPPRTDEEFPTKTPARRGERRLPPQRGHVERIDHMKLDQTRRPTEKPWFTVPEVREQLRLDGQQFDKMTGTYTRLWSRYNDIMSKYPDNLSRAERFQRNEIALNRFQGDLNATVDEILSEPSTRNRFKQLDWQYKMYDAFNDPVVRSKLKLTDEQLQKLNLYRREWNRDLLRYEFDYEDSPDVVTQQFLDSRIDAQRKIKSVLTPEQQGHWNELLGEPYDFAFDTYYGPEFRVR